MIRDSRMTGVASRRLGFTLRRHGLVLALAASLAACGGGGSPGDPAAGFTMMDLARSGPERDRWERERTERAEACRRSLERLMKTRLRFDFSRGHGPLGWKGHGELEPLRVESGVLLTRVLGTSACLARSIKALPAEQANLLVLEMSVEGGDEAIFRWRREGEDVYPADCRFPFQLEADGRFHLYRLALREAPDPVGPPPAREWRGAVDALRIDLPPDAGRVAIRRIELIKGPSRIRALAERLRHGLEDHAVVNRVSRPILPVGRVTRWAEIPAGARLSVRLGVIMWGWVDRPDGPVHRFRLCFEEEGGGGRPHILYDGRLSPATSEAHRRWVRVDVDLSRLAGRRGHLVFETGLERAGKTDWRAWQGAVWGSPLLLAGEPHSRGDRPPNLLLISLDTLRSDRMGCYGHPRNTTAQIDRRLVRGGALFTEARSPAPWTLPAHVSLFTGLEPQRHGVETDTDRMHRESPTLASALKAAGYRTAAVTGGGYVAPEWGFDRGFDVYSVVRELTAAVDLAERFLDEIDGGPFFLFFHTYETHADYTAREPFFSLFEPEPYPGDIAGRMVELQRVNRRDRVLEPADVAHLLALYDSEVGYTDMAVGRILAILDQKGLAGRTLVVLLSDHGEEFYEHGGVVHGRSLYDELLRVPLIFRMPGRIPAGLKLPDPVSLIDVYPTVLDLMGLPGGAGVDGRSWASRLEGRDPSPHMGRAIRGSVTRADYGDRKYALYQDGYKVIVHPDTGRAEGFDLLTDPSERMSLVEPGPAPRETEALLEQLRDELEILQRTGSPESPAEERALPPETVERLRRLGYLE